MVGAGVNTSGRREEQVVPFRPKGLKPCFFPPFLSNRWQGKNILYLSSLPMPLPLPFPPWRLLSGLSPHSWTRTLPNEVRKTQAAVCEGWSPAASAHPLPTATFSLAISPLFSHLSLSFPYFPPLAQQPSFLLLVPSLFCASLAGCLTCSQAPATLQGS